MAMTIHIPRSNGRFGAFVQIGINGRFTKAPVGIDYVASDDEVTALTAAGVPLQRMTTTAPDGTIIIPRGPYGNQVRVSVNGVMTSFPTGVPIVPSAREFEALNSKPIEYLAGNGYGTVAPVPSVERIVSAGSNTASASNDWGAANSVKFAGRKAFAIGSGDVSELRLRFDARQFAGGEQPTSGHTFTKVALETNGVTVIVTFSGSRTLVLAAGDACVASDVILPSAFGLTTFARDRILIARFAGTNSGGQYVPYVGGFGYAGEYFEYGAGVTDAQVDATGQMTSQGGTQNQILMVGPTCLSGKFVDRAGKASVLGVGDSIFAGLFDLTGYPSLTGPGLLKRALVDSSGVANYIAGMHSARSGDGNWITSSGASVGIRKYMALANVLAHEFGTNEIGTAGTTTAQQVYDNAVLTIGLARGEGVQKIITCTFQPRTTGTFTTTGGQTPVAGWTAGGTRDQLIQKFRDALTAGTINGIAETLAATQASGDPTRWGTPDLTTDGTHESNSPGNAPAGAAWRTAITSQTGLI